VALKEEEEDEPWRGSGRGGWVQLTPERPEGLVPRLRAQGCTRAEAAGSTESWQL